MVQWLRASSRRMGFNFQHSYRSYLTPVSKDLRPSYDLPRYCKHMVHIHKMRAKCLTYKIILFEKWTFQITIMLSQWLMFIYMFLKEFGRILDALLKVICVNCPFSLGGIVGAHFWWTSLWTSWWTLSEILPNIFILISRNWESNSKCTPTNNQIHSPPTVAQVCVSLTWDFLLIWKRVWKRLHW